jgi:hypothetical protein
MYIVFIEIEENPTVVTAYIMDAGWGRMCRIHTGDILPSI